MNFVRTVLKYWLVLALVITALSGMVYLTVQQSFRLGANDPQIQMAEDAAAALESGQPAAGLVPPGKVDIARSLAPYLIVFGPDGKALASNAVLHGQTPALPDGVLDYTRRNGEDRISYQPEPGVRSAAVIAAVNGGQGGFVLAGRSLREVEKRIDLLGLQVGAAWAAAILASLALVSVLEALSLARSRWAARPAAGL
ncbi:MAG TPA: hypothetical protein VF498_10935 [Anaerolineales bacterium]